MDQGLTGKEVSSLKQDACSVARPMEEMEGNSCLKHYYCNSARVLALLLIAMHLGCHPSFVQAIRVPEKAEAEARTAAYLRSEFVAAAAQAVPRSRIALRSSNVNSLAGGGGAALGSRFDSHLNGGSSAVTSGKALPFVMLHGAGECCKQQRLQKLTGFLEKQANTTGFCIEVGNGFSDSFKLELSEQADTVCRQVKEIAELSDGYNMVGLSQGNLIGRAVIEQCDDAPPVHNFVSIGGPHAGVAAVPFCGVLSHKFCELLNKIVQMFVYSSFVQSHFAPAEYMKIPTSLEAYYKGSTFLPKLNNELSGNRNETYKRRFSALNHLALIQFKLDKVLIPASTAWFGFYAPNDDVVVLAPEETELYRYDWIGLKALDNAGKVSFIQFEGEHLRYTDEETVKYVVPFLLPPNSLGFERRKVNAPLCGVL